MTLFSASTAFSNSYDLNADFSSAANPNGPWSFGWMQNGTGAFHVYNTNAIIGGSPNWYDSTQPTLPTVWKNLGSFYAGVATGQVSLHPGYNGQYSVVRWTASTSDSFDLSSTFFAGDVASENYIVRLNGTTLFASGLVNSTLSYNNSALSITSGDVLDFITGGNYYNGNTPLDVKLVEIPSTVPDTGPTLLLIAGPLIICGFVRRRLGRWKSLGV